MSEHRNEARDAAYIEYKTMREERFAVHAFKDDFDAGYESATANHAAEIERLKIALADAIRLLMGVCPDSAIGLISEADMMAAEGKRCSKCGCPATDGRPSYTHNIAELEAEIERLRAALEKIADHDSSVYVQEGEIRMYRNWHDSLRICEALAQTALNPTEAIKTDVCEGD